MVIPLLASGQFLIKTGIGGYINLTAENRPDPFRLTCLIKINHPVHDPVVCDGGAVHAQFLHTFYILFDLIGTVQQTVFCVDVKMCKCHWNCLLLKKISLRCL